MALGVSTSKQVSAGIDELNAAGVDFQMDLAIPAFIQYSLDEIIFYSIGTGDNRGAMGLGEFAAKKIGEEEVSIGDVTYSS